MGGLILDWVVREGLSEGHVISNMKDEKVPVKQRALWEWVLGEKRAWVVRPGRLTQRLVGREGKEKRLGRGRACTGGGAGPYFPD